MSELKSDQNPLSSEGSEEVKIKEELGKVPHIAEQESKKATPVADLVRKEEEAFAGENEDSALIVQFAEHEEKIRTYHLQNEQLQLQNDKLKLENTLLEHKNKEEVLLDDARRDYTKMLFILTVAWLVIVVLFVLATGLKLAHYNNPDCSQNCANFSLSEKVLIAFITSTTATVIGIFIIVAKWLFPSPHKEETKEKETEKKKE